MSDSVPEKVELDCVAVSQEGSTSVMEPKWEELRRLSLSPGGFGKRRVELWTRALGVAIPTIPTVLESNQDDPTRTEQHQDERQIHLDTDRSFVLYPVGDDLRKRERLQDELYNLVVSLFRKRQRLHYFQGYHDIVSVLFLTLPEEFQLPCVEKVSLHRLRDSMGTGLEPIIGLLRILKRLLDVADPDFSSLVDHTPLPYYALSNLLTLFSHDIPTLPLIQHVFDYLLSRPPIAVVYLAAAIVLTRKNEVRRLTEEDEEGMIHSLLSSLPDLFEEEEEIGIPEARLPDKEEAALDDINSEPSLEVSAFPSIESKDDEPPAEPREQAEFDNVAEEPHSETPVGLLLDHDREDLPSLESSSSIEEARQHLEVSPTPAPSALPQSEPSTPGDPLSLDVSTATTSTDEPATPSDSNPPPYDASPKRKSEPPSPSTSAHPFPHRPRISLSSVLKQADELFEQYPPTDPSINILTIMGPQSVMLTWSEHFDDLPSDDEAELMVLKPELVVLPPPEEPPSDHGSDEESTSRKGKEKSDTSHSRRRRKLHKARPLGVIMVQRKAMVASAVVVLGVAMAVYGTGGFRGDGGGGYRAHREWRALSRFVGALLFGAGEKLLDSVWG